jgi:hypothetical protein
MNRQIELQNWKEIDKKDQEKSDENNTFQIETIAE